MINIDNKLIVSKLMDKINISKTRNKIVYTEFLTIYEMDIIKKELNRLKLKNYFFHGGYDDAEGKILVIFPEKFDFKIAIDNLSNILKAIKIELPKEMYGKYTHRNYLGAVMNSGLNRNRIGDIIVYDDGAYIMVLEENSEYISDFLGSLSRFSKAKIHIIDFKDILIKEKEFEEIKITVSSMRLDNITSELAKISRRKALELLSEEKVFINSKAETKSTKAVHENDIIAIRGTREIYYKRNYGK